MEEVVTAIIDSYTEMFIWLCALMVTCSALEWYAPCNPGQPRFRKGMFTDILYYFIVPFLGRIARMVFVAMGIYILFHGDSPETINRFLLYGYGPLSTLPIWLQAAIVFILSDIAIYWMHRWFHGKRLWRYHAIHHSSEDVDWLSTYRFHPINTWVAFSLVDVSMLFVGFSPAAVGQMVVFNTIYSALVHTNVNWTFGPFKYIFASPVFHRWHHTTQSEGLDKNFAPTFPLLDIIFGTFYMPDNRLPEKYGVDDSDIPYGFWGQMIWPFKKQKS